MKTKANILADRKSPRLQEAGATLFRLKTILVPVDFSVSSKKILRYARSLGEQFGARIILLHVVEPKVRPEGYMIVPSHRHAGNAVRINEREVRLAQLSDREAGFTVRPDVVVQMGEPWKEIINLAKRWNIDLVILGTRGLTGLKHTLLGSTAERVVRHAPCPVLVVREKPSNAKLL